jgi:sugar lactone lactonase YvrE
MYNPKDGYLYVGTYSKNIYKITDLRNGVYREKYTGLYDYEQATPTLDPSGEYLYVFNSGTLKKYRFSSGYLVKTFRNLSYGSNGVADDGSVAVSENNIFTWDAYNYKVYMYDLDGNYKSSFKISKGNYGFSLTYANGMLFTSKDGDSGIGTWYGYDLGLKRNISGGKAILTRQFDDEIPMHNFGIAFDGTYYYTNNGGNSTVGQINKYTRSGSLVATYDIDLDMRGIMYNKGDGYLYVGTYGKDIYKITNLKSGYYSLVHDDFLEYEQSTPAFDPTGRYIYTFNSGTLKKYSLSSGNLIRTFTNLSYGSSAYGGNGAVAISENNIFTCDINNKKIYVYDLSGNYEKTLSFSDGDCGFSLNYENGHLWISKDGNGGTGTWYGYKVGTKNKKNNGKSTGGTDG